MAGKEIEAFVPSTFTLCAYTNGSRFVKGSEDKKEISVMEDFYYKGINASISSSRIKVAEGKEKKISLHLENICNGDVMVELGAQIPKGWKITFGDSKFVIHSKFSKNENKKNIELRTDNEKGGITGIMAVVIGIVVLILLIGIWRKKAKKF